MAKMRIKNLQNTATIDDLTSSNYIPIDCPDGTKKLPADILGTGSATIYNTVADMKADTTLAVNDIVETKRFYDISAGFADDIPGGCTYQILANQTANGMDIIALNNGLYAKAILINEAYPEQLGYQLKYGPVNGVDLTPYIDRMSAMGITTIKLNRTGHTGSDNTSAVYRIKSKCTIKRSMKIEGCHADSSGYSTRIYFTPSADNTDEIMFESVVRSVCFQDLIIFDNRRNYEKSIAIRLAAGTEGSGHNNTDNLGNQFHRLNIQGFKYGILADGGFTWHCNFDHVTMAVNYINVRLERLVYCTKFYNCLFNVPQYRSIEVGSPFTLEFDTCNFGVKPSNDTLLNVERWDGPTEIPRVDERDGFISFSNSQFEYEKAGEDSLVPTDTNKHIFVHCDDDVIATITFKNHCFIQTPLSRAQNRTARLMSLGKNSRAIFQQCGGPLSDVDIQPGTANQNYFLEKDYGKYFFDETRMCRKQIGAITVHNSLGIDPLPLCPDSHLAAIQVDGNSILRTNDTDMSEYYKTPQGTQFLNLDNNSFETYISDKVVNINTIPGNFIRIGKELYEYVEIDGLKWITRNINSQTPYRNNTYWDHLDWGRYYYSSDIVNVESMLPAGWRIPTDADIASLCGDGSASRARALQSTNYQSVWPNATNSTGFNMVPSYYWKRPSQRNDSNFNVGFLFGQAVSNGRRNIWLRENDVRMSGWSTTDLTNLYVPTRVCAD